MDTPEDYRAVLDALRSRVSTSEARAEPACPTSRRWPGGSAAVDYLVDEGLATSMFLSLRLPQPLLLEGEAGVGKTEAAQGRSRPCSTRR